MKLEDFDYALPLELIAQHPLPDRTASRLLHVTPADDGWTDRRFTDLPDLVAPGDLVVMNDTRVLRARLLGRRATGGRAEVLVERVLDDRNVLAQVRTSKTPAPGTRLVLDPDLEVEVTGRAGEFFELRFRAGEPVHDLLERHGRLPLPPYIRRDLDAQDESRYQTVFGSTPGAVAAPTAGLHFDLPLLDRLRARGADVVTLTLHVGAGTFQPVRVSNVSEHKMHAEWYDIPPRVVEAVAATRAQGGRVLAVGTTSLRALESAALAGELRAGSAQTELFVTPGFRFRVVDRLVTNFHLPKSTLLMLVSAFGGKALMHRAYEHAVAQRYRFFSYGDAMLIERAREAAWQA